MFKYLNSNFYHSSGTSVEFIYIWRYYYRREVHLKNSKKTKVVYLKALPQMQLLKTNATHLLEKK